MMGSWQPIDTAPIGKLVLVATAEKRLLIAKRIGQMTIVSPMDTSVDMSKDAMPHQRVVWWQPLPDPPE